MSRSTSHDLLYGRNPVLETLRSRRREVHNLVVQQGLDPSPTVEKILAEADRQQIPFAWRSRQEMDNRVRNHQGVQLQVGPYPYVELTEILELAQTRSEPALLLILDQLQDPQNFGTLLRSAEAVGVHGVLLPVRHSVRVTPAVVNSSSGASEHLYISRVNLAQAMNGLKKQDIWMVGLEGGEQANPIAGANLSGSIALVVGSEGEGLRPLVRKTCDFLVKIPMRGKLESLNASVAGSLALYRIWEQRGFDR